MGLAVADWIDVLDKEYLAEFVPQGGASVKIAVTPTGTQRPVLDAVADTARRRNYSVARIDAGATRVQFIEQVFFAVSRQIDWPGLAERWLRAQFTANGTALPPEQKLNDVEGIAAAMGISSREVVAEVRRWIANGLLKDYRLTRELRTALAMFCQAAINPNNVSPSDADVLLEWLHGGKYSLTTLKKLQIFTRIGRHNARQMLTSLARWLHVNEQPGLVVLLDAAEIWSQTPPDPERPAIRYTRNSTLDFFEILRQFIDETDDLEYFLLVVGAPPEFWTDPKKGVSQYGALQMRVSDEVRDRERTNPLGTAVRLETVVEVGA